MESVEYVEEKYTLKRIKINKIYKTIINDDYS